MNPPANATAPAAPTLAPPMQHTPAELVRADTALRRRGEVFADADIEQARAVILDCLSASKPVWNNSLGTVTAWVPDTAVRLKAAELVINHGVGTPVQRVIHSKGDVVDVHAEMLACFGTEAGQEALALVLAKHPELAATLTGTAAQPAPAPAQLALF
jgi:hypothetical protein